MGLIIILYSYIKNILLFNYLYYINIYYNIIILLLHNILVKIKTIRVNTKIYQYGLLKEQYTLRILVDICIAFKDVVLCYLTINL